MSIGPYYAKWAWTVHTRFRWFRWEGDYMSDASAPGQWRPASYRYTLFGVPVTWWKKVNRHQ
jgi:hypothetical protein